MSDSTSSSPAAHSSSSAVQFVLNSRMRSAFKFVKKHAAEQTKASEPFQALGDIFRADGLVQKAARTLAQSKPTVLQQQAEENASIAPPAPAPKFTLTFAQVQLLSRLYRETIALPLDPSDASDVPSADTAADESSPGRGFVHELLLDSAVAPLPPARSGRVQDPAFKRYLQEQRWKQDRREYHELVRDLPGNKRPADLEGASIGAGVRAASRDIGHGVNIISLMITGFVVFYYVGCNLFPHNHIFAVMCGLLGLVGALMVEVCLFLVREQKSEMGEVQQAKMARAQKARAEEIMAQRHMQAKKQEELERRAKVLREQQSKSKQEQQLAAQADPLENKMD